MISTLNILIIEDDEVDQRAIMRAISKSDVIANMECAADGKSGLKLLEGKNYDLLFIDYLLPDINGIQIVKEIVKRGISVPMVVVTSQTDLSLGNKAINAGATNYLTKSLISPEGVSLIIRNSINIWKIQEELEIAKKRADDNAKIKQEFLANMSHEIRTPMNAIIGYARLMLDAKLDPQQAEYLQTIYTSSENLLMIINDILDFSKIESGKLSIENIVFNLQEVLENVVRVLDHLAHSKGISLNLIYDDSLFAFFRGDPYRINQVILNLVSNAIKFTHQGEVTISVRIKNRSEDSLITLVVEDTGIGISESALETLFESFVQADSNTTRKYGGTGLGLSIVKKLAELMAGEVRVKSTVGKGSTFEVLLPLARPEQVEVEKLLEGKRTDDQFYRLEGLKVLLVDDNAVNRHLAKIHFLKIGCDVDFASDGLEAVNKGSANTYDLVFMDIQMPLMDGIEATRELLKKRPELKIIGMSAHVLKSEIDRCMEAGMIDYLTKPYKLKDLYSLCVKHGEVAIDASTDPIIAEIGKDELSDVAGTSVFDEHNLVQLKEEFGGDEEIILELLEVFVNNADDFLAKSSQLLHKMDRKAMQGICHKIAPGIHMLGNGKLYDEIRKLEMTSKTEDNHLKKELAAVSLRVEHFKNEIKEQIIRIRKT